VPPGKYKAVVKAGSLTDSTVLTVHYDPRSSFNEAVYQAQAQSLRELEAATLRLTTALDQLNDMEDATKKIEAALKDVTGKPADSLRKSTRQMQDSIKAIREFVNGKEQTKQGYGSPYQLTVTGKIREAQGLITGKKTIPGAQEAQAIQTAATLVQQAVNKTTQFARGAWARYQQQARQTPLDPFGQITPME
ncbi:MAG TPA: hypothetical protein PKD90_18020, partial [Phnomibacter sp.]|nr:hypothetical protein [Phnomibacter sp.]